MQRSVEQALASLIPRYNGSLPPELVELASSLLALSRSKASNLKAEEEIGRTYACANIACERLKQSLNLPQIEPRPPCAPRIYKKLYTYLDTVLAVRKRGRPPKSISAASSPTKPLPSKPTPTKDASLAPYRTTPSGATVARKRGLRYADSTNDVAPWIHPTIRSLCRKLEAPSAAPHILAGVTTILTQPSPSSSIDRAGSVRDKKDKIPALLAAVYFFVRTRLSGRETSGKEYVVQRKGLLIALAGMREDPELNKKVGGNGKDDGQWEGWEQVTTKDVDAWLLEISAKGWLSLDWFQNIVEGGGVEVIEGDGDHLDFNPSSELAAKGSEIRDNMRTGLGAMIQDRYDYLSDKRRADYRIWKQGIMERIELIEAQKAQGTMDTSEA